MLMLPRGPFLEAHGGRHAYVLDGDRAVRRDITVGATSVSMVEITSGLAIGDRVVIAGSDLFEDAGSVRINDWRSTPHADHEPEQGHGPNDQTHALRGIDIDVRRASSSPSPDRQLGQDHLQHRRSARGADQRQYQLDSVTCAAYRTTRARACATRRSLHLPGFNLIPDLTCSTTSRCRCATAACRRRRRMRIEERWAGSVWPGACATPAELSVAAGGIARALAGWPRLLPGRRADRQPRLADGAQRARAARGDQRARHHILMVTHDPDLAARAGSACTSPTARSPTWSRAGAAPAAGIQRSPSVTPMFAYYFGLGMRQLRRNPVLTGLMIIILGAGVAASMSTLTVLRAMSADPIPHKSDRLFAPLVDIRPDNGADPEPEPPYQLTYRDAAALRDAKLGVHQSAQFPITPVVSTVEGKQPPFFADGLRSLRLLRHHRDPVRRGRAVDRGRRRRAAAGDRDPRDAGRQAVRRRRSDQPHRR